MRTFQIIPYQFKFKRPGGTSRGVMTLKKSWFIALKESNEKETVWGECSIIEGLSPDYQDDVSYFSKIEHFCKQWQEDALNIESLKNYPSIQFGLEIALQGLKTQSSTHLFDSEFTHSSKGIPINGLVWMGEPDFMREQIREKLKSGYTCIKMKIGAIDWKTEQQLLSDIRKEYTSDEIEIRVDANGAFNFNQAKQVLHQLAELEIHSIEQPIAVNKLDEMAQLCATTPCPIALDEELIGKTTSEQKENLLRYIQPQYIILKPSLIGGFSGMEEWINMGQKHAIPWWATSALESNIGLNAIAQYTATFNNPLPQGLGTGSLYTTNIPSPLFIENGMLFYDKEQKMGTSIIK